MGKLLLWPEADADAANAAVPYRGWRWVLPGLGAAQHPAKGTGELGVMNSLPAAALGLDCTVTGFSGELSPLGCYPSLGMALVSVWGCCSALLVILAQVAAFVVALKVLRLFCRVLKSREQPCASMLPCAEPGGCRGRGLRARPPPP